MVQPMPVSMPVQPIHMPTPRQQATRQPAAYAVPPSRSPAQPNIKVRGQSEDSSAAPIRMPLPSELGIAGPKSAFDWSSAHARLRELGVLSFQLERLTEGGYRFHCRLPDEVSASGHSFEARGATEGEAVETVLVKARQWVQARR
jgi:hypothetical protein